jgi:hypothetical protein
MKYSSIDTFLNKLEKELSYLSVDKENYITEVTDHLYSLVEEKKAQGLQEEEAITQSINEFPSPKVLARDLVNSDKNTFVKDPTEEIDFKFRYKAALIVMGLGELSLILVDRPINFFWIIIGILMLIAGNVMVLKHRRWNKDNVKQLLWVIIGTWICLPLALFLFFRRDDINMLLISYMIILTLLIVVQHFITFKTFKTKNHKI